MDDPHGTRIRIIDAAERLFAQGDESATSTRAITREAEVNVAAVHYHFRGRDELLRIVLDRQVAPINERRLELLAAVSEELVVEVPLRRLLDAFLRPDLEALVAYGQDNVQLARFIGRSYNQPSTEVAAFMDEQFAPIAAAFFPMLERSLPHMAPGTIADRMRLVVAIVTSMFATSDATHVLAPGDLEPRLSALLDFCCAGLEAPTEPTKG